MARQSFNALDVMLSNSEASAFKPRMKSRSFGGVYPDRDEGPQDDNLT
jgi:hypothetical protein